MDIWKLHFGHLESPFIFKNGKSVVMLPPAQSDPDRNHGLKSFSIRDWQPVAPGQFLVASTHGLFLYSNKEHRFEPLIVFDKGRQISTADFTSYVYADTDGYIWLATVDGIARFPIHGQSFGLIRFGRLVDKLPPNIDNIRGITGDEQDNLWIATGAGFIKWDWKKNRAQIFLAEEGSATKLAYPSVRGIVFDGRYVILGPTNLGLWLFDPVRNQYRRPLYDSASTQNWSDRDFVDAITTLQNGNHVIMGRDAMYVLDGKTYRLSRLHSPAGNENSNFCYQTKDGYVWVTTQGGLHLFDNGLHFIQKIPLPSARQFVSAGFATTDNKFLFTLDNGLYTATYENKKVIIEKKSNVFESLFITSLFQDKKGLIWAASDYGIYRYDTLNKSLNLYDYTDNIQGYGFNANSVFSSNDGTLFLGGINGINYLNPDKLPNDRNNLLKVYISAIKLLNDSVIYDVSKPINFSYNNRSFEVNFTAPYFNNTGKLQYRYRLTGLDDKWKHLGNNNQLRFTGLSPGKYVLEVEASINKTNWIRASNNFSFTIRSPFWLSWWFIALCMLIVTAVVTLIIRKRSMQLRAKQEELEVEQAINYFSSSMYNQHSVHQLLWDVAKNCIGRLHFEDCVIYLLDREKKVLYQKAAYGAKSMEGLAISNPIEIPLGVGITGYAALHAKPVIVKNTMLDERYIADDRRRMSEIAVPIIADGIVYGVIDCEHSKKGFFTQRHLNLLQTIASLCAGKIVKIKAEVEKAKAEKLLMETKQKMADVEMQALRAQMNPHFIFNCLNSINRYIVKSDQATASLYLTRFAKLIRLILDNSNSSTVTLSNELEALKLYIEMEAIRFEKKFTYSISFDKEVQADAVYVPPLIIQPYVENSIWHGLLHKEDAGHMDIHISKKGDNILCCVIEDNGVGRAMAKELKSKSASTKKSLGMKLTEDRLAQLSKQSQFDSSVQITDLYHDDGTAAGTRVTLCIPIDS